MSLLNIFSFIFYFRKKFAFLKYLMWIISPTKILAGLIKNNSWKKFKNQSKVNYKSRAKFYSIIFLNRFYFFISLLTIVIIFFKIYQPDYFIQFFLGWLILSRCNEIFLAFIRDAFDKLDNPHKKGILTYKGRLHLAFISYLELILNFAILYFLLYTNHINAIAITGIKDIIDAIYFSGTTITTLGYGDILPTQWYTKLLTTYEVICGFTLLLVSFTIYTTRATEIPNKSS